MLTKATHDDDADSGGGGDDEDDHDNNDDDGDEDVNAYACEDDEKYLEVVDQTLFSDSLLPCSGLGGCFGT